MEFGRFAAERQREREQRRPEKFDFLEFTHCCGTDRQRKFQLVRPTAKKRRRADVDARKAIPWIRAFLPPRFKPIARFRMWIARPDCIEQSVSPGDVILMRRLDTAEAVKAAPESAGIQDTIGWIYYPREVCSAAAGYLKRLADEGPNPRRQFYFNSGGRYLIRVLGVRIDK